MNKVVYLVTFVGIASDSVIGVFTDLKEAKRKASTLYQDDTHKVRILKYPINILVPERVKRSKDYLNERTKAKVKTNVII